MDRISWWRTTFGDEEIQRIADAINHEHISQGPVTAEFEKELSRFLDLPYVVATTSGSMALLMSLLSLGIGPGDEVIVPNRTWIATAHAPLILGAKVKLVDVEADRPIIDVTQIEKAISPRTKVIIPVHLNGRAAAMDEIGDIAHKYNLFVIEDACQALGSRNANGLLGTQSDMGCFSLSVAKIIATGQGGYVVTRNESTYRKLIAIRTHGVSDVINANWTQLGFNFRFTDILASIGLVQLTKLPERMEKVKSIYRRYETTIRELPFLKLIPVRLESGEIPIYIEVLCRERDRLMKFLGDNNVQTRPFYPDLNFASYFGSKEKFPNSEIFGRDGLFLPCGPDQTIENIDKVLRFLKEFGSVKGKGGV
jgi:perosamine synthetase